MPKNGLAILVWLVTFLRTSQMPTAWKPLLALPTIKVLGAIAFGAHFKSSHAGK